MRQLKSDLMFSAGFQINQEQAFPILFAQNPITQGGLLTARRCLFHYPILATIVFNMVDQSSILIGHRSIDHGQIVFFNAPFTNLLRQTRCGLGGAGKNDNAGHRPVQTMDHPQKNLAGLVIPVFQPLLAKIQQAGITGLITLYQKSRGFVNDKEMVVQIEQRPARFQERKPFGINIGIAGVCWFQKRCLL